MEKTEYVNSVFASGDNQILVLSFDGDDTYTVRHVAGDLAPVGTERPISHGDLMSGWNPVG